MSIALRGKGSDLPAADRPEATATPTIQWDRKLSPPKVSSKREFLRYWLETFSRFSLELPTFGDWRRATNTQKAL
jgi:hypothetical protein